MAANSKYKDSVFTLLFSDENLLRDLYCALGGVSLPADTPVKINTLRDALFMDRINDISFEIGGKLVVLVEHQSTINPNIPLRMLMYIARVYEKIVGDDRSVYASKRMRIPSVEFIVVYNGTAPFPDERILRLSDMYDGRESLGLPEPDAPALELVVRVVNINHGRNATILGGCRELGWYSAFIAKAREFEKELGNRTKAIKQAVLYCRDHDILREFLEKHGTEVLNMLTKEWKLEDALAVRYEEGLETGRKGGERNIVEMLKSGRSPEEIIRDFDTAIRTDPAVSEPPPWA
jgi:hypothetical protein